MVSFKSILLYFVPRRIKLKDTILCVILFVLILVFLDDYLNNYEEKDMIASDDENDVKIKLKDEG